MVDPIENKIYAEICRSDGIRARDIGKRISEDRSTVNHFLYNSPFMRDLCWQDEDFRWHGQIRQTRPHVGLSEFSGWYGSVPEFLALDEETWMEQLTAGCAAIGRNLNDTRGLLHSFRDCRETMRGLFRDLAEAAGPEAGTFERSVKGSVPAASGGVNTDSWEILFELRIRRSRMIRIYADVLVLTEDKAFSLEFKMKEEAEPEEIAQAAKYTEYLEVILGPDYDVIPCLVLTRAADLYRYVPLGSTSAELPVVSGDMLFNLFDEYLGFLAD